MNKPVAYWDGKHFASKDKSSLAEIPLYTHPKGFNWADVNNEQLMNEVRNRGYIIRDAKVSAHPVKELTDEEIMEIVEESYMPQGLDKSRYTMFAKAILRKAQEK